MADLAYRLHVSEATVSKFLNKWMDLMHINNLKQLIIWPDTETLRQNLPSAFRSNFSHTKCIIDCFEIFIERPLLFTARTATYSNYKKQHSEGFHWYCTNRCNCVYFINMGKKNV